MAASFYAKQNDNCDCECCVYRQFVHADLEILDLKTGRKEQRSTSHLRKIFDPPDADAGFCDVSRDDWKPVVYERRLGQRTVFLVEDVLLNVPRASGGPSGPFNVMELLQAGVTRAELAGASVHSRPGHPSTDPLRTIHTHGEPCRTRLEDQPGVIISPDQRIKLHLTFVWYLCTRSSETCGENVDLLEAGAGSGLTFACTLDMEVSWLKSRPRPRRKSMTFCDYIFMPGNRSTRGHAARRRSWPQDTTGYEYIRG